MEFSLAVKREMVSALRDIKKITKKGLQPYHEGGLKEEFAIRGIAARLRQFSQTCQFLVEQEIESAQHVDDAANDDSSKRVSEGQDQEAGDAEGGILEVDSEQ